MIEICILSVETQEFQEKLFKLILKNKHL
jgi:hypothetical protein